jgi:predicted nucleic acid-binding protein
MMLIDEHALSDGVQLADALIAATALEHDLTLLTGNQRHFTAIVQLKIERFNP